jgi:murein DD-endopeptidase MepM/ murein hydrolase activator NlpD
VPAVVSPPAVSPEEGLPKAGTVKRGQTSFVLLRQAGVSVAEVRKVHQAIRHVYNLHHMQEGQPYSVTVAANGSLQHFMYELDAHQRLEVKRQGQTFVGRLEPIAYDYKRRRLQGTMHGSLYAALAAQGGSPQIVADLTDIFSWDIDFHTDLRRGDSFRVLIEERYRHGKLVGYQRILAAEVVNRQRVFRAVYYPAQEDQGTYYRPDGSVIRRMFLRSPLHYSRISSQFSLHRFHPILGQYRPHLGIDYAAPAGTPVRCVADGVIAWAGMKGASGNMVEVRHNSIYSTFYLHLSRFASDIQVGKRVVQGEVIGYVGATGLATGPHLDFRLTKEGKYLNPLEHSNQSIEAPPLPREALPAFRAHAKRLLAELSNAPQRDRP